MAKYSRKRHLREINYKRETDPEYKEFMDKAGCYFGGCFFLFVIIMFIIISIVSSADNAVKWLK